MSNPAQVLEYVEITGAIMEKAASMMNKEAEQTSKIAKLIDPAVKALLENDRIEPHEKEAAVEALRDPVRVLEILIKTAAHRNDAERGQIGKPTQSKNASNGYNSLNDNYVGRRSAPGESESYKAFKRGIGL